MIFDYKELAALLIVVLVIGIIMGDYFRKKSIYVLMKKHLHNTNSIAFFFSAMSIVISFICVLKNAFVNEFDTNSRSMIAMFLVPMLVYVINRQRVNEFKYPSIISWCAAFPVYLFLLYITRENLLIHMPCIDGKLINDTCVALFTTLIGLTLKGLIDSDERDRTSYYFIIFVVAFITIIAIRAFNPYEGKDLLPILVGFAVPSLCDGIYTKIVKRERKMK